MRIGTADITAVDGFDFDFAAPAEEFDFTDALGASGVSFEGLVQISGKVSFTGEVYRVTGTITAHKSFVCDRCLKKAERDETYELQEEYAAAPEKDGVLPTEENGEIDLKASVRETILAAQGVANYCREDCLGLCPVCGKDLNDGDCGCDKVGVDPRLAVLQDFMF